MRRASCALLLGAVAVVVAHGGALAQPKPAQPPKPWPPAPPASAAPQPSAAPTAPASSAKQSAIPPAPSSPSQADVTRAKAVFDAGGRAYEQGDFTAAIQAFQQAYSLSGRPSILFSLAQAHKKRFTEGGAAGDKDAAIELYRAYLAAVKTGGRRGDAIKGLEALGGAPAESGGPAAPSAPMMVKKTQLAIDSPTPGALISIDGSPPAPPQVVMEVTPTRHTVKVEAPGYISKEFTISAQEGMMTPETYELEEQPAKLQIDAEGASIFLNGRDMGESTLLTVPSGKHFVAVAKTGHQSDARPLEIAPGSTQKLSFDLKTTRQRDAAIGMMVAGGVTIVLGGLSLGYAFLRQADAQAIDRKRQSSGILPKDVTRYDEASQDRDQFRALGIVVGGVGGLGLVIGGGLFLFDSPPPKQPPSDGEPRDKGPQRPSEKPSDMEQMSAVDPGARRPVQWSLSPVAAPTLEGWEVGGTWTLRY